MSSSLAALPPMYHREGEIVSAERGQAGTATTTDTVNWFLYGLKSAVTQHQGCVVDKMAEAHLGLYITTLNLVNAEGHSDASVIAVALAVPLNGVPVYMDHYVLILRESEAVDGQVNALLASIGQTLDRHTLPGQ